MRDIKLRVFDKLSQLMFKNDEIIFNSGKVIKLYDQEWFSVNQKDIELMQYTGLKDKNGKEVYEGDIIEDDFNNSYLIDYRYGASCVVHALSCRAEAEGECKFDYLYDFMKFYNIEVIGNIYENKELLEHK